MSDIWVDLIEPPSEARETEEFEVELLSNVPQLDAFIKCRATPVDNQGRLQLGGEPGKSESSFRSPSKTPSISPLEPTKDFKVKPCVFKKGAANSTWCIFFEVQVPGQTGTYNVARICHNITVRKARVAPCTKAAASAQRPVAQAGFDSAPERRRII
jgi:hypothetical protein